MMMMVVVASRAAARCLPVAALCSLQGAATEPTTHYLDCCFPLPHLADMLSQSRPATPVPPAAALFGGVVWQRTTYCCLRYLTLLSPGECPMPEPQQCRYQLHHFHH